MGALADLLKTEGVTTRSGASSQPQGMGALKQLVRDSGGYGDAVSTAKSYLGTPYKWGGTKSDGIDCSGLTQCVYKNLPRTAAEQWKKTSRTNEPQPGDLVFLKDTGGRKGITHVGIYAGDGKFIHAAAGGSRKVIEDRLDTPYNKSHFAGYGRPTSAPAPKKPTAKVDPSKLWEPDKGIGKAVASSVGGYAMDTAGRVAKPVPMGSPRVADAKPAPAEQKREPYVHPGGFGSVAFAKTPEEAEGYLAQTPRTMATLGNVAAAGPEFAVKLAATVAGPVNPAATPQVQDWLRSKAAGNPAAERIVEDVIPMLPKDVLLMPWTMLKDTIHGFTSLSEQAEAGDFTPLAMSLLMTAGGLHGAAWARGKLKARMAKPSVNHVIPKAAPEAPAVHPEIARAKAELATIADGGEPVAAKTPTPRANVQNACIERPEWLVSEDYIEAKKNPGGYYELFFRGTRNEVFPGEKFRSAQEARGYWKAQVAKYNAQPTQPSTTPADQPAPVEATPGRATTPMPAVSEPARTVAPKPSATPAKAEVVSEAKTGTVVRMKTKDIGVDPHRFQFRMERNPELENVKKWDVDLAGVSLVWKDPATGKTWVVNGHHRLNLANRLKVDEVDVRYINAETAAEARVKGALVNIAEGRASAVDAAKLFRDSGITADDLTSGGVSLTGKVASDGMALSKLNDNLFNAVIQGKLTQDRAAAIGRRVSDSAAQDALYALIQKKAKTGKPLSAIELDELTRRVLAAPDVVTKQVDLFGASELKKNLAVEEAQLSGYIREQLRRDKTLFGRLSKEAVAKELERGRNIIEPGENARIAAESAIIDEVYSKLSGKAGSVSDILHAGAERIAAKENINVVKAEVYRQIREEVSAVVEGRESGRLRPAQVDGRTEPTPTSQTSEVTPKPTQQFEPTPAGKQAVMEGTSLADTFELTNEKAPSSPFNPKPTAKQAGQTGMFDAPKPTPKPEGGTGATAKAQAADAFAKAQEAKQAGKLDEASKALDDVADAALRRIEERNKGRVKAGVDPFDLADITIYTAAKIAKGAVDSANLAAHLAEQFGPEVARRAKQVWDDAVTYLKNAGHDVSGFKWSKQSSANDPAKYAGSVNLSKWDTVDDIKTWARETYERNKGEIDEQRRGVRTHEETVKASHKSGMAADLVKTIKPGTALNAEHVLAVAEETIAAETKAISLAKRLEDIRDGKLQGNVEVAEAEALKAQADADLLFKVLNGTASEAGRALEIHKVVRRAYEHAVSKPVDIFEPTGPVPAPIKIGKPLTKSYFTKDGRLFNAESARTAWERLKTPQKSYFGEGTVMGGIPVTPQMIADMVEVGGYLVDRGAVEFGAWAARMKREVSDSIDLNEGVLRDVWEKIRVKASELSAEELAARAKLPKTLKGASLKELRKLVGGKENVTQDMLYDLSQIDDTDVVSLGNFLRQHNKVGWGTRVEQYGYSGMFSGTNPHWRNLIGNITQGAMIPAEKVAAFAVDAVRVPLLRVFGVDTPRRYYMGELPAAAKAYFGSFPKGAKGAWQVMKHGMNAAELERKIEMSTHYDLPDVRIKGKSYMNPFNIPLRMLGAIDEWARTMWKGGIEKAHEVRAVKSGKPVRADIAEYAEAESMYYAQMEPFSKFMEQVADVVDYAIPKDSHIFPGMRPARLLVPVFRTATNMLRKAWFDYSPLGTVKAMNKEAWVTGEASKVIGKTLAGTAAITTGIYLYSQGKLTGKAPDNPNERKIWYEAGNQPYTMQVGNKRVPFIALGIVGLQWAAISDYLDAQEQLDAKTKQTGEPDTNAFIKKLAASIEGQASAAPFFAGINQVVDLLKQTETAVVDLAANIASRAIPASGAVRQVARATDPTVKETGRFKDVGLGKSIKEKVMSDIPGLSKKVPVRVNSVTGGKTVRQNVGGLKGFFPYTPTEMANDPVIKEMMRLNVYPSGAGKSFKKDGKVRQLTRAEYQEYERSIATWYSSAKQELESDDYKTGTDKYRTLRLTNIMKISHDLGQTLTKRKLGLIE